MYSIYIMLMAIIYIDLSQMAVRIQVNLRTCGVGFLQAGCPSCYPTNSVEHGRKLKPMTQTTSSSLLYASSPRPINQYEYNEQWCTNCKRWCKMWLGPSSVS